MVKATRVWIAFLGLALSQPAFPACGHPGISIDGSRQETADTCRALSAVLAYFHDLGFDVTPSVRIFFKPSVWLTMDGPGHERVRVSGLFDAKHKLIFATSWNSDLKLEREPWGIRWGPAIGYSILQHEFVHLVVGEIRKDGLSRTWREFIAYAVEFELMESGLRKRVIANYPNIEPFRSPQNVNPFIYAFDPDAFGLKAYLYTRANGGRAFIGRLLTGRVSFRTGTDDYFWPMR